MKTGVWPTSWSSIQKALNSPTETLGFLKGLSRSIREKELHIEKKDLDRIERDLLEGIRGGEFIRRIAGVVLLVIKALKLEENSDYNEFIEEEVEEERPSILRIEPFKMGLTDYKENIDIIKVIKPSQKSISPLKTKKITKPRDPSKETRLDRTMRLKTPKPKVQSHIKLYLQNSFSKSPYKSRTPDKYPLETSPSLKNPSKSPQTDKYPNKSDKSMEKTIKNSLKKQGTRSFHYNKEINKGNPAERLIKEDIIKLNRETKRLDSEKARISSAFSKELLKVEAFKARKEEKREKSKEFELEKGFRERKKLEERLLKKEIHKEKSVENIKAKNMKNEMKKLKKEKELEEIENYVGFYIIFTIITLILQRKNIINGLKKGKP